LVGGDPVYVKLKISPYFLSKKTNTWLKKQDQTSKYLQNLRLNAAQFGIKYKHSDVKQ